MSTEKVSACSTSRSQSYTPMTVETCRSLIDTMSVTLLMLAAVTTAPDDPMTHLVTYGN
jgi:hypothetical protein